MNRERTLWIITWAMQLSLLVLAIGLAATGNETWVPATVISFLITLIPMALKRTAKIVFPVWLVMWIVISVWLHSVGGALNWYNTLEYWDHITHAVSSSLVAAIGFVMVAVIDVYVKSIYLPRNFMAFFVFTFGMAIGVLWELLEFWMDNIGGSHMQYGLQDTMIDYIFDGIAAGVVGLFVFAYLKKTRKEDFVKDFGFDKATQSLGGLMKRGKKAENPPASQ